MTAPAIDTAELVRLWKDPDARARFDRDGLPPHPAGEIELRNADPTGAHRMAGTVTTFAMPSVSGPCLGLGPRADDRS